MVFSSKIAADSESKFLWRNSADIYYVSGEAGFSHLLLERMDKTEEIGGGRVYYEGGYYYKSFRNLIRVQKSN